MAVKVRLAADVPFTSLNVMPVLVSVSVPGPGAKLFTVSLPPWPLTVSAPALQPLTSKVSSCGLPLRIAISMLVSASPSVTVSSGGKGFGSFWTITSRSF